MLAHCVGAGVGFDSYSFCSIGGAAVGSLANSLRWVRTVFGSPGGASCIRVVCV